MLLALAIGFGVAHTRLMAQQTTQEIPTESVPESQFPGGDEPASSMGLLNDPPEGDVVFPADSDQGNRKGPLPFLMRRWRELNQGPEVPEEGPSVFGVVGIRGFADGSRMAPNGYEFTPIGDLTLNFNLWICREHHLYGFANGDFWLQKAAPGITNARQGAFDFSKREFDMDIGLAWNYWGAQEFRFSMYSLNNLNRGKYKAKPWGFADGTILENRWYLGDEYTRLGTAEYDIVRANFISAGYYPSKELVDNIGGRFKPGPFLRAYLTLDLFSPKSYLFTDTQLIGDRSFELSLLQEDFGVAFRPFEKAKRLEFRLGGLVVADTQNGETDTSFYGQVRFVY